MHRGASLLHPSNHFSRCAPGGRDKDDCLERAFWSSVTINPPLYGADTPISLFDDQLEYGCAMFGAIYRRLMVQYAVPCRCGA